MKLTTLLLIFALVMVACSPDADTVQQENNDNTEEVIENTDNEAQTVATTEDDAADSSTEDMDEDSDMASDEMEDMDDTADHSDDMASDDSDMSDSDDSMMDESADNSADMASDENDSDMMEENTDDALIEDETEAEPAMDTNEADTSMTAGYSAPDWANLQLTNAKTGESFSLADFAGKTVFIEPMATWCTNCRGQQRRIKEVVDQLSPDEYVVMSLSVETYLSAEELSDYANRNEFGWTFAVATEELVNALVTEFGRSVSSPPSVPHFTISPDGSSIDFATGSKSGEEFLALVRSVADGS